MLLMLMTTFSEANTKFDSGVALFKENQLDSAITLWNSIEGESVALHYNLGNAWYQKGELGKSILHYEKALKLNPKDEEVLHNLSVVKNKRIDAIEELPEPVVSRAIHLLVGTLSANGWIKTSFVVLFSSLFVFAIFLIGKQNKKRHFLTFILLGLFGASLYAMGFLRHHLIDSKQYGVVIPANVYIKNGPSDKEKDAFILHEGTTLEIQQKEDNWLRIKLSDGKIGWVKKDAVEVI